MRRSQTKSSNIIQPAVQRSQPPIVLDEQRLPIQDDELVFSIKGGIEKFINLKDVKKITI